MANAPAAQSPAPPGGGTPAGANAPSGYSTFTGGGSTSTGTAGPNIPTTAPDLPAEIASKQFAVANPSGSSVIFSQTQQLLALLDSLEKGRPFSGVDQAAIVRVFQGAKVTAGEALTPKRMGALRNAAADAIRSNLGELGISPPEAKAARTATQFSQLAVPQNVLSGLKAQGYNVDNVNTVSSLTEKLAPQQSASKTANGTLTGADIYAQFQHDIATPAGAAQMAQLMNAAGMSDGTLTAADGPAMLTYFQQAMSKTPANSDPFSYLQTQAKSISAAGIAPGQKPDSAFSYVNGLANTIWGNNVLTSNDINAIAAEYPDAGSSTADDTAIRQAVAHAGAQTWTYDPNQVPAGGSYLASVVNQIQDTAGQYAVPLSPQILTSIVKDTLESGDLSSIYAATDAATASAELHAKAMSSSLFPSLAPMIKQGFTTQAIMSPYKTMAADTLGVSADNINLTDPQWASLLESPEGKLPSVNQFQATVMQDPRFNWQNSADAETKFANMASTLVSTWGKVGGGPQSYNAPTDGLPS